MKNFFITATDTDAGKTFISCALIKAFSQSYKVAAFKPVAAGCELEGQTLINEDAKYLFEFANAGQSLNEINPIAFTEAIAPHIAAQKNNQIITIEEITKHFNRISATNADITLIEGAGGWRLPLTNLNVVDTERYSKKPNSLNTIYLSDFAKQQRFDVILVVNMKLGCLNHALLTYETIKADGLNCIAWVANNADADEMHYLSENIASLEQLLPMPKIAELGYVEDHDEQGNLLNLSEKINRAAQQINIRALLR